MQSPWPILLLMLIVAQAGCLGSTPDAAPAVDDDDEESGPAATPGREPFVRSGTLRLAAGGITPLFAAEDRDMEYKIGKNATAVLYELRWRDPEQDLSITVLKDGAFYDEVPSGGVTGSETSVRHTATSGDLAKQGSYVARLFGDAAVDQPFDLAITVFYDGDVPEDFSSLP